MDELLIIKNFKIYMKNELRRTHDKRKVILEMTCAMNMTLTIALRNQDIAIRERDEQNIANHVYIIALIRRNLRYLQRLLKRYEN